MKYTHLLLLATASLVHGQESPPLRLAKTIALPPAIHGSFDHLAIDPAHNRLFVTAEDSKTVLVIDPGSGKVIHSIEGLTRPHAVLYRDDLNRIYVTDGDSALKVFDGTNYALKHTVQLAKDADSIGYDRNAGLLYIDNGGKDEGQPYSLLTIIDTGKPAKLTDIRIDGETLEAMALDVYRPKLYVNNKAKNQVEVVDRVTRAVIAAWPMTMAKDNVAIALDEPHQRLFVVCRSGQMVVFDTNTGKELQAVPIVKGVDDAVYDPGSKRIYVAGDGAVSVIQETDADHYSSLGDVPSGPKAKTALLVPELNRYFVSAPGDASHGASILVFETSGAAAAKPAAVEAKIPVHATAAEKLILLTLSAHPWLRKMGLHAAPPGYSESVIIANGNTSRLGVKSSDGDLAAVKDGKTSCVRRDDGAYFNMKMPMMDAHGRKIGILVMEIPLTSATDEADAIRKAEELRAGLSKQIPDLAALFK